MPSVSTKAAVSGALLLAVALAAVTLLVLGFTPPAAAAAARNTARFSGLVFALALAGSSLRLPATREALLFAFVAAHAVHYAAVLNLAVMDPRHDLHQLQPGALGVAAFGTVLLLAVALTIGASPGWKLILHRASLGIAWLLFAIAFGSRARERTLDLAMLIVMLAALGLSARAAFAHRARAAAPTP